MHLTWHIIRKDFHRLRAPLLVWALLQFLASALPTFVWFHGELSPKQIPFLLTGSTMFAALSLLAAYAFSARLVQEDSPARADAFWRVKPISGLRLLSAKGMALTLFSAAAFSPVLILQLVTEGLTSRTILSTILTGFLGPFMVAILAFPFAVLTRSLRQCILVTVVTLLAIFVASFFTLMRYDPIETDLFLPRIKIASAIILCAVIGGIIAQFVNLPRRRPLLIVSIGVLASLFVLTLWPWKFPSAEPGFVSTPEPAEATTVSITFDRAKLWDYAEFWESSRRPNLDLEFIISPPSEGFLSRAAIRHQWEPDSPPSVREMDGWIIGPDVPVVLGQINPKNEPSRLYTRSIIPHEIAHLLRSGASLPSYKVDLFFNLHRTVVTEIPLQAGAVAGDSQSSVRFLGLDAQRSMIELLEHIPIVDTNDLLGERRQFILYNSRTGKVLRGSQFESSDFAQSLSVRHLKLRFGPYVGPSVIGRTEPLDADFLRDAILVKISFPVLGYFTRTIEIPNFKPALH